MPKRTHISVACVPPRSEAVPLPRIANMACPETDNCAIAVRQLPAGTAFFLPHEAERDPTGHPVYTLSHELLEGHRFAVAEVPQGERLISWGLPFGVALRAVTVGEYIMNALMGQALRGRREVTWALPEGPNFKDVSSSLDAAVVLDEAGFVAGRSQAGSEESDLTFMGYARPDGSAGTRNDIVVVSITSHSARFARSACERLGKAGSSVSPRALRETYPNVDAVMPVAHNEGGADAHQNNAPLILRVLANYVKHPNVGGAALLVSPEDLHVTRDMLAAELQALHGINAGELADGAVAPENFAFVHLTSDWDRDMEACAAVVQQLAAKANQTQRTPQNVSKLRIALQCGGSDSFSGITGNPLVGAVAANVVRYGGSAVLAETPELVGAEPYILQNCASADVARQFLHTVKRYMEYADRHGQDAAGNPSGGNLFRGLYNIALKSLGASRKKPADTTLDGVLAYGERIPSGRPGYYFMDSPGNDLESIAGQVASGCNMVYFVTGNGAITNFPFVPTLKVVTTSGRFAKLARDMDVDAGVLNAGVSMPQAAGDMLDLTLRVAGGQKSKGEAAGHSQVSLWRNWYNPEGSSLSAMEQAHDPHHLGQTPLAGSALQVHADRAPEAAKSLPWIRNCECPAASRFNLVLPTSLCSSQIARLAAERLTAQTPTEQYRSLPHTEGCGGGGGAALDGIMSRVLAGHLFHPLVKAAFVLEHGCEKTHNDWLLSKIGADKEPLCGWGSVQGDGGIEQVVSRVGDYFRSAHTPLRPPQTLPPGLILAVMCRDAKLPLCDSTVLAQLCLAVAANGGTVLLPQAASSSGGLLRSSAFISQVLRDDMPGSSIAPTLAFAEPPACSGLHVMDTQGVMSCKEVMTGLGACGATAMLWWAAGDAALQAGHMFIPTLHATAASVAGRHADVVLPTGEEEPASALRVLAALRAALEQRVPTRCSEAGSVDFSIPRGMTSISL